MSERDAIDAVIDQIPEFAHLDVDAVIRVLRSDPLCPRDIDDEQLRPLATEMVRRARERNGDLS